MNLKNIWPSQASHFSRLVGQYTHPAVLVDGPEPFHGHIPDVTPPKQDLACNKVGNTDIDLDIEKRIINLSNVYIYDVIWRLSYTYTGRGYMPTPPTSCPPQ